jgi:hypothetical protein
MEESFSNEGEGAVDDDALDSNGPIGAEPFGLTGL